LLHIFIAHTNRTFNALITALSCRSQWSL